MLSFEFSAIDLILMVAVIVLLILYITKLSTKTVVEEKTSEKGRIPPKKPARTTESLKTERETPSSAHPPKYPPKCPHSFGYLKQIAENAPVPDECLSCSKIIECLYSNE